MEQVVDQILDGLIERGQRDQPIDLIKHFATPVPTHIICKVLGVPDKDIETLSQDSEIRNSTSRNAAESGNKQLQTYMQSLTEERIKQPQDDLISKLVKEQYTLGKLSKEDISTLAFLVLTAGNAALINSIGLGTLTLLQHPDQLAEFKEDPSLAVQVVHEITRFHTASALNSRRAAKEDFELDGQCIKKGEGVICSVQSADRDEYVFPNPDRFDIHRKIDPASILGFGHGPHRCQGEWLSRA